MLLFALLCLLPAFWTSFFVTALMRKLSPQWGLIDTPAARKVHRVPTPLGGGIGIMAGVILPLAMAHLALLMLPQTGDWFSPEQISLLSGALWRSWQMWGVVAGATLLGLVGLADDFRPLGWKLRLGLQFAVAGVLVAAGVRGTFFLPIPYVGALLTVLWMVVLVNSFNFLDNMDGLSAGVGLVVCSVFGAMMLLRPGDPRWLVGGFFLVVAGSLIGFLCHNWSPARIFMGDAGSYFLGFSIASMTILGTFYRDTDAGQHVVLAPFCVLAVPLYDLCSVVWIRLREGRSPFQPDKRHFSHRLVSLGLSPVSAVLTVHLVTLTTGLVGMLLYFLTSWVAASLALVIVAAVLLVVAILESAPRPDSTVAPSVSNPSGSVEGIALPESIPVRPPMA